MEPPGKACWLYEGSLHKVDLSPLVRRNDADGIDREVLEFRIHHEALLYLKQRNPAHVVHQLLFSIVVLLGALLRIEIRVRHRQLSLHSLLFSSITTVVLAVVHIVERGTFAEDNTEPLLRVGYATIAEEPHLQRSSVPGTIRHLL